MPTRASGPFEVNLDPQPLSEPGQQGGLGRMSIVKQFHGDLVGESHGEMLAMMGTVEGSAGYVAIERVIGTLHGRKGSFALQHSSTMARGVPSQNIVVVPDSGTDQLTGLAGQVTIRIDAGKHSYDFDYELPVPE